MSDSVHLTAPVPSEGLNFVTLDIVSQGAPVVNDGYIHAAGADIVAIYIDLKSKRCEVVATGGGDGIPSVWVGANEESLHLNQDADRASMTEIAFPEYDGWDVFSATCSRYTLAVCLTRSPS
jgi:hypothetical protein